VVAEEVENWPMGEEDKRSSCEARCSCCLTVPYLAPEATRNSLREFLDGRGSQGNLLLPKGMPCRLQIGSRRRNTNSRLVAHRSAVSIFEISTRNTHVLFDHQSPTDQNYEKSFWKTKEGLERTGLQCEELRVRKCV
jgi:hypothetical protein